MSVISRAISLDHLVLTVKDIDASVKFYEQFLGVKHKINLHLSGHEFESKAQAVQPGSADLCFLVEDDVNEVAAKLHEAKITVLEEGKVVDRTGARSKLRSVYIRDPDGNLIELSNAVDVQD